MKNIIEISGPLENGMWDYTVFPEMVEKTPPVKIETTGTVKDDGFYLSKMSVASISGTYLEAGSHVMEEGRNLSDYELRDFIRPLTVIRLPRLKPKELISTDMLRENVPEGDAGISPGDALIVDTGWWENWNKPGFVTECPNYGRGALAWILEQRPSIFGVDVPCIEAAWNEEESGGDGTDSAKGSLLIRLFAAGTLLAAPLCYLGDVPQTGGFMGCFPLPVQGTSGAPSRIIYFEE